MTIDSLYTNRFLSIFLENHWDTWTSNIMFDQNKGLLITVLPCQEFILIYTISINPIVNYILLAHHIEDFFPFSWNHNKSLVWSHKCKLFKKCKIDEIKSEPTSSKSHIE